MKQSIREELLQHVKDLIEDGVLTLDNTDDWHFHAFNEDYYIIGYYNAEKWLERHNVSVFEALEEVHEWERFHIGEIQDYTNAEALVNMYVYVLGEELLAEEQESLEEELEERQQRTRRLDFVNGASADDTLDYLGL